MENPSRDKDRPPDSMDRENALQHLTDMFSKVMNVESIAEVFECCNHNFDSALDALMEKADDRSTQVEEHSSYRTASQQVMDSSKQNQPFSEQSQPLRLCVTEAQCVDQNINTRTIHNQIQKPTQQSPYIWDDQIRNIITNHNEGNRLLILMRGLAGSGKTHLAKQLVDIMIGSSALNYKTHIFSTDDFFMIHTWYNFDRLKLQDAHKWNQNRVKLALSQGLSPIIVDNTNIEKWEMEHYVRNGVANGYIIEVVEPNTPWAKNPKQLYMKNIHKVPLETIKRKLENYCEGITGNSLLREFGLFYPANMVPPVKRLIPEVPQKIVNINNISEDPQKLVNVNNISENPQKLVNINNITENSQKLVNINNISENPQKLVNINNVSENSLQQLNNPNTTNLATPSYNELDHSDNTDSLPIDDDNHETAYENALKENILLEAQKRLEDIKRVEQEWENGEHWDEEEGTTSINNTDEVKTCLAPRKKPSCSIELKYNSNFNLMELVNNYPDWSVLSKVLPERLDSNREHVVEQTPVQKASHSTSMECGDMDVDTGKYKVISTTSRDINEFYIPMHKEKIPEKRMLDQSSMTNQQDLLTRKRCKNEDKHFIAFKNLFKEISSSDLRDIFDKCDGDVNWAVDIVLGGKSNKQFKAVDTEEMSGLEEEGMGQEQCECLSAYGIVPDLGASFPSTSTASENFAVLTSSPMSTLQPKKKVKKNITVSANSKEIKKQIEQSVVIHDSHYSEHSLKIRKQRRNENNIHDEEAGTSGIQIVQHRHNENNIPDEEASTSGTLDTAQVLECNNDDTNMKSYNSDDEESNASSGDSQEMVTINVGSAFISELDRLFGRTDMVYPDYIAPKISLPMSILNEINALWEESLTDQVEEKRKEINFMIKADEKFARELAMEERELVKTGKEPALPEFKEIMDMEVALQIYRKDVDKWRNNIPKDLAAKMTRDKLFNLFLDIEKDILSELLMAHENNFQATVETLLMSTGQEQILEEENGVDKFIMMKELEHQQKILNEKRKVLSETEWPMLPLGEDVEMSTVESYRKEAEKYLYYRNLTKNKAQDFSQRKIASHATYFSELSSFYTQKYEQAASLAATALIQLSASKGASFTMDLHHLYVKEALEAMDLFIDGHIRKLKECQTEGALQKTTLFLITGRGLHSRAGPRIKPAVRKRLRARGLPCRQLNPGMFATEIRLESRLSYQLLLL